MSVSVAGYVIDTIIRTMIIINDINSSSKVPFDPYWKVLSYHFLPPSETTQWLMDVMLHTLLNSSSH